eukprot:272552_1
MNWNTKQCCSSTKNCQSLKRVAGALHFYSSMINDESFDESACALLHEYLTKYPDLMNDYAHLIYHHLNGDKYGSEYERICNYLHKHVPTCPIDKCLKYNRNSRDREHQCIKVNFSDEKIKCYIDLLDTIHSNLLHSFDIGFRIPNKQMSYSAIDENSNDKYMNELHKTIVAKKQSLRSMRGMERINNNKFMTNFVSEDSATFNVQSQNNPKSIQPPFSDILFDNIEKDEYFTDWIKSQEYDSDSIIYDINMHTDQDSNICEYLQNKNKLALYSQIKAFFKEKSSTEPTKQQPAQPNAGSGWFIFDSYTADNKISDAASYGFGIRFYYWPWYKNNKEQDPENPGYKNSEMYVEGKYSDLKEEISACMTEMKDYNEIIDQIKHVFMPSDVIKAMTSRQVVKGDCPHDHFEIPTDSPITVEHLTSILLYTNLTKLSYDFSKSFRRVKPNETVNEVKKRHYIFANWARLLRETIEAYGQATIDAKSKTYFHGTSFLLFDEFDAAFCGPTSCSPQIEVAMMFTNSNNGIILQFEDSGCWGNVMFLNCSFLSAYGHEDERLFIGGYDPVRFHSIRLSTKTGWQNYHFYIKPLNQYHSIVKGNYYSSKIQKTDVKIIKKLIAHLSCIKLNTFPSYINSIFARFCEKITELKINFDGFPHDSKYYNDFFISPTSNYLLSFSNIIDNKIFKNLKIITLYDDAKNIVIDEFYMESLLKELKIIKDTSTLQQIVIIAITKQYKHSDFLKWKQLFIERSWDLQQTKGKLPSWHGSAQCHNILIQKCLISNKK